MSRLGGGARGKFPKITMPQPQLPPTHNLQDWFMVKFDNQENEVEVRAETLEILNELGRGAYGIVEMMRHRETGNLMAVKRIHSSPGDESHKRMVIELNACLKSGGCPQMVRSYGAMFREGDVWICMEVMDISLDKFYKIVNDRQQHLPEMFCAKVALAVVEGLNFMKRELNLIHRDVKPSNVLLNRSGAVKLCDFGISGHLTNSVAKTVNAGCKPYMPPERIDGDRKDSYDVRADVWSLGISLIEIASGSHPYSKWRTPFEQLKQVVLEPAPTLPNSLGYSEVFQDFVNQCLIKDFQLRPKYPDLLQHQFLITARDDVAFDLGHYVDEILKSVEASKLEIQNMMNPSAGDDFMQ